MSSFIAWLMAMMSAFGVYGDPDVAPRSGIEPVYTAPADSAESKPKPRPAPMPAGAFDDIYNGF